MTPTHRTTKPPPTGPTGRRQPPGLDAILLAAFAAALAGVVLIPAAVSAVSAIGDESAREAAGLVVAPAVRTAGVALLVGIIAVVAGWPLSVAASRRGALARPLLAVGVLPLLLPNYLLYAGAGLLIAPDTPIGSVIASAAEDGARWLPGFVRQAAALVALGVWASPLAGLILLGSRTAAARDEADVVSLDTNALPRRVLIAVRAHAAAIIAAIAAVAFVTLGSCVPLHLSQIRTHAIVLWSELSVTPPDEIGHVWLASWPLVLLACIAGIAGSFALGRAHDDSASPAMPPPDRLGSLLAAAVVAVAVLGPAVLFWLDLGGDVPSAIAEFVRTLGDGLIRSVQRAAVVAAVVALLAALAASSHSGGGRASRIVCAAALASLLTVALLPGVLVGATVGNAARSLGLTGDAAIVIAHAARFGFVGVAAGVLAARFEPGRLAGLRSIDGARGIAGWLRTGAAIHWPLVLGAGAAAGALSLHEIEAAVMLEPPGPGAISVRMLDLLHFARMEELSAGAVVLIGGSAAVGLVAGVCTAVFAGSRRSD